MVLETDVNVLQRDQGSEDCVRMRSGRHDNDGLGDADQLSS